MKYLFFRIKKNTKKLTNKGVTNTIPDSKISPINDSIQAFNGDQNRPRSSKYSQNTAVDIFQK